MLTVSFFEFDRLISLYILLFILTLN
uniref:Uncharacterized protein n=1 Tax=Arundo donax TaxID=35708 RepID=A0A0A9BPN4_ARUDO